MTARPSRPILPAIAGLAASLALLPAAHAQINPFHTSSSGGLSRADVDAITDAAGRLNADPAPAVGKAVLWRSTSGLGGTVTIDAIRRIKGMDCHRLTTGIDATAPRKSSAWTLTWCRTPAGNWRILN